jgi:hypothetical protein
VVECCFYSIFVALRVSINCNAENSNDSFFFRFSLTMTTTLHINDTLFNNDHLHGSVANGQLYLVQRLIANGCDPNLPHTITGLRPIHFAASRGHVNLVKFLIESSHCQVDAVDKEGEVNKHMNTSDGRFGTKYIKDCTFKSSLCRSLLGCKISFEESTR